MDIYTIKHPYNGKKDEKGFLEIEIKSDNLYYGEIGSSHYGLQHNSNSINRIEIKAHCKVIANSIRELDKLTKDL